MNQHTYKILCKIPFINDLGHNPVLVLNDSKESTVIKLKLGDTCRNLLFSSELKTMFPELNWDSFFESNYIRPMEYIQWKKTSPFQQVVCCKQVKTVNGRVYVILV